MRALSVVTVVGLCCGASWLGAQSPRLVKQEGTVRVDGAPTVTRGDTLGANFDHTKPGTGTPADFDFLIGKWRYQFQSRNPEPPHNYTPARPGTWTFVKTHSDLVVDDEFATELGDGNRGVTVTYRVFNPERKLWEIQGLAARRGLWAPGIAWSDGKDRYLVQDYPERHFSVRIRYYSITPNHFLWRADGTQDGGKTWVRDVWVLEANRITP
jgi:hypothetical protein